MKHKVMTIEENFNYDMGRVYFSNHNKKSGIYHRGALFYGDEDFMPYIEAGFMEVTEGDIKDKFHVVGFTDLGWAIYHTDKL